MGAGSVKRVLKGMAPPTLAGYVQAAPRSSWEQMRDDPYFQGRQAYQDCRSTCIADQKGLCAYCEVDIRDNDPLKCHVEHFHPKADQTISHNWALDWPNMLAVCNGGSVDYLAPPFYLPPRQANLSCDAHKDWMIQQGKLPTRCEGWILNPLRLAAFPSLFRLEMNTGNLYPNAVACDAVTWPGNQHASIEDLVQHTINVLNLNCDRLAQERLRVIRDIEHNKKRQRERGFNAEQGLSNLARQYLRQPWPAFFTVIRWCLGQAAERYLQSVQFAG